MGGKGLPLAIWVAFTVGKLPCMGFIAAVPFGRGVTLKDMARARISRTLCQTGLGLLGGLLLSSVNVYLSIFYVQTSPE